MKKTTQKPGSPLVVQQKTSWYANIRVIAGALFVLAFLIYSNSLFNGFVLDDSVVITKNQFTTKGISGVSQIFTTHAFAGFYGEDLYWIQVYGARYRPLSMAIFAVIYQFFGDNSLVFHIWNVLTYALCCVFLYVVLQRIFSHILKKPEAAILAGLATLFFTVHPVHTEVVANIKSNDEILALLLSMGALYMAVRYHETGKKIQAALSGILLFVACFAKENSITFLAIIPLTFFILKNGKTQHSFWPLLASLGFAFLAYFAVRWAVIGLSLGEQPMELINNPFVKVENGQWVKVTSQERLAMTFYSLGKYLQLLVFPYPLTTDYYPRYVDLMTFSNVGALASLFLYLGLGAFLAIKIFKKQTDPVVYGLFFFAATLSIVSNLVFPIGTNLAERFIFMPSVGFCLAAAGFLYPVFANPKHKFIKPVSVFMGLIAVSFAVLSFTRNFDFESNKTLFSKDLKVSEKSAKMQNAVGALIAEEALHTNDLQKKTELAREAKVHLDKAIEIHPSYLEAYYMRGNTNFLLGDYEKAIQDYRTCLSLNPNYKRAYGNYALALREAGRLQMQEGGSLQTAIEYLEESLRLYPNEQETAQLLSTARSMGTGTNQ